MRICSASKESVSSMGMASSPSTTNLVGRRRLSIATTSGKYRASGLPDFALRSTSPPARKARQRKPSHFGSNCQPGAVGISVTSFASIGSILSGTARLASEGGAIPLLQAYHDAVGGAGRVGHGQPHETRPPRLEEQRPRRFLGRNRHAIHQHVERRGAARDLDSNRIGSSAFRGGQFEARAVRAEYAVSPWWH